MISFTYKPLNKIDQQDMEDLKKALSADPLGGSQAEVRDAIASGKALLWSFWSTEGGHGVVLTTERRGDKETDLFIWCQGGFKAKEHYTYMQDVLDHYCRRRGIKKIRAQVPKPVLRLIRKVNYKVENYIVVREVPNGTQDPVADDYDARDPAGI